MELGGVVLGVFALVWPVWYLSRRVKGSKRSSWAHLASLGCCGVALWDQLLFQAHLAAHGKVSAWQDTAGAAALVSGLLLLASLVLNGLVLGMERELGQGDAEKKGTR